VRHGDAWFGISKGYRYLTRGRIERRYYRRLVTAASLEETKRAIDRMPYPALLLHARIAIYWIRAPLRNGYLRATGFGNRILRALGFRAQRVAGKGSRLLARTVHRLAAPRPSSKNGRD
jgi:hypothetical protein